MNFGFPQFFWALFALSIPLLVHLFNLRRPKTVFFSNTRFLLQLEQEQRSVKRLRHWLVLLLRGLALAALVLAFTLPFKPSESTSQAGSETYLHIYLDNSLSMQRNGQQGPLLNQARIYCRDLLQDLPEGLQVQILSNDVDARFQRYYSPQEALELVEQLDYSANFRDLESVLSKIRDVENSSEKAKPEKSGQHEILLISDFQNSIFPEDSLRSYPKESIRLIALEAQEGKNNVSLDSISFEAPVFVPGLIQNLKLSLRNHSLEDYKGISLELWLNDTLQQARLIDLAAQEQSEISLAFIPQHAGAYRGELRINKGEPVFDNKFFFSFQTIGAQKLYFISEVEQTEVPLQIFENQYFDLKQSDFNTIDYNFLAESRLIILQSDLEFPESLQQRLEEHLQKGKNIWLLPANSAASFSAQLQLFGISAKADWESDSLMAQEFSEQDPFLANSFESGRDRPILPYSLAWLSLSADEDLLPLLSAGPNRPLIARKPQGKAQVFFSLSSLDRQKSNLAQHPILVPLLANAALFTAQQGKHYLRSGKSADFQEIRAPQAESALELELKEGKAIPYQVYVNDLYRIELQGLNVAAGNYRLSRNQSLQAYLSVNGDARESELAVKAAPALAFSPAAGIMEVESESQKERLRKEILRENTALWPWFIALAILFFLAEMILIKSRAS